MMLVVLFAELLLTKVFSGCHETDIARPRQISKNTTATKSKAQAKLSIIQQKVFLSYVKSSNELHDFNI